MFEKVMKYKEIIYYLIFGGLTTLINIIVFYLFNDLFNVYYLVSNVIAWVVSVLFAYITNKTVVFKSDNKVFKESVTFFIFRVISLGIDMLFMYLLIDIISIDSLIAKIIVNVIVVILNYVFSKLFIFKKKNK